MSYKISKELKNALLAAIGELNAEKIFGTFYKYKRDECSCCYGAGDDFFFEINENIPNNWGIFGTEDPKKVYHKITFSYNAENALEKAKSIFRIVKRHLSETDWKISWQEQSTSYAMIITMK